MRRGRIENRRFVVPAAVAAGLLLFLFLYIDDWSRDLVSNEASISADANDSRLRPLTSRRSSTEMVEAVRAAAGRIRSWEYVGEASDGNAARLLFVRTSRLLRLKDDIVIRVEDLGEQRRVTGESRSRVSLIGDLGGNPRSLRRFLGEIRDVLKGAGPPAAGGAAER